MSSGYVTKKELAEHFVVAPTTVEGWVKKGLFPPGSVIKVGRTYRFKLQEVEAHFQSEALKLAEPESEEGAPVQLELPLELPEAQAEDTVETEDGVFIPDFDSDEDV